ncbi:MAG: Ig-like domain-containing protein [Gemmatimonadaceae bacterium]
MSTLGGCLGDASSARGVAGEAAIDLRGLRLKSQTSGGGDAVQSARFVIYLVTGTTRRAVASRLFTAQDLDAADSDTGTVFTMTFPYTSVDDKFEVLGWGMSAEGDTLYAVGPVTFTMRDASSQGGQASVKTTAAPVYVGPGRTATKLVITPRTVTTSEGKTVSLTPTLYDAKGTPLSSPTFRYHWWTGDGGVARFMDERVGVVTGGPRSGSTWIFAQFNELDIRDSVLVTNTVAPSQLRATGGQNQSGPAGSVLGQPIRVQVLSASGEPVAGVTVGFTVTSGGGSVSAASRVSASDGSASVTWTLGATIGAQQLTASVTGLPSVVFFATAVQTTPSPSRSTVTVLPTAILVGGDEAVVSVVLRDNNGSPMPNITVTFSGASALTFTATSGLSDGTGTVTTRVRASEPGTWSIVAMVGTQVIGSTSIAVGSRQGIPASISIVSGDNQTVKVGTNFPLPLVVVVKDASGKPVPGALVDWSTAVGDGRRVTDSNGQSAAAYYLTPNFQLGLGTITVTLTGYGATATFHFTAVP